MRRHPPGRCLDQSCRNCYSQKKEPIFKLRDATVQAAADMANYSQAAVSAKEALAVFRRQRQMDDWVGQWVTQGYVYMRLDNEQITNREAPWCWICRGPCLFWYPQWGGRRSEFDNGRVIDGEVVHHEPERRAIEA